MADLKVLAERRRAAVEAYNRALRAESARLIAELRARRKAMGLTQQQVADVAGVSRAQITNAESPSNDYGLSIEALTGYALAVGCRLVSVEIEDDE